MLLALQLNNGYGAQPGAWRLPGVNLSSLTDMDEYVRHAQAAERGKIQLIFMVDTPVLDVDLEHEPPHFAIDPLLVLTAIARETERIGLVATSSTTFNEPYTIARQFKALDVISRGRAGWNAVTTSHPAAAANYGRALPSRTEKYERAHEVVQIVQALWGSWEQDAWLRDVAGGRFADMGRIRPVALQGRHVASRGPLPIPPSEQGQPVVFQAGGGANGLELAARYASGVYANPYTIEDGQAQRAALRDAAERAGRDPDEVKLFAGFMPSIAPTLPGGAGPAAPAGRVGRPGPAGALPRRHARPAARSRAPGRAAVRAPARGRRRQPAGPALRPRPARSRGRAGPCATSWPTASSTTTRSCRAPPPTSPTTCRRGSRPARATASRWPSTVYHDGIDAFVDQVVPLLQAARAVPPRLRGATLRDHLGVPAQYGLDPRLLAATA